MQNVKSILADLDANYPEWKQELKKNNDFTTYEDEVLGHRMLDLVFAFRRVCKERESCDLDIFMEWIDDADTVAALQNKVEVVLIYYKTFRPLREVLSKDPKAVKDLLEDAFYHFVLRLDPGINRRCKGRIDESENVVEEILLALDNLTDYYVKRLYVQEAVEKDFEDETGLSRECCELYGKLYEEHFSELRLNLILYGLNECQTQLQKIEDFM